MKIAVYLRMGFVIDILFSPTTAKNISKGALLTLIKLNKKCIFEVPDKLPDGVVEVRGKW